MVPFTAKKEASFVGLARHLLAVMVLISDEENGRSRKQPHFYLRKDGTGNSVCRNGKGQC